MTSLANVLSPRDRDRFDEYNIYTVRLTRSMTLPADYCGSNRKYNVSEGSNSRTRNQSPYLSNRNDNCEQSKDLLKGSASIAKNDYHSAGKEQNNLQALTRKRRRFRSTYDNNNCKKKSRNVPQPSLYSPVKGTVQGNGAKGSTIRTRSQSNNSCSGTSTYKMSTRLLQRSMSLLPNDRGNSNVQRYGVEGSSRRRTRSQSNDSYNRTQPLLPPNDSKSQWYNADGPITRSKTRELNDICVGTKKNVRLKCSAIQRTSLTRKDPDKQSNISKCSSKKKNESSVSDEVMCLRKKMPSRTYYKNNYPRGDMKAERLIPKTRSSSQKKSLTNNIILFSTRKRPRTTRSQFAKNIKQNPVAYSNKFRQTDQLFAKKKKHALTNCASDGSKKFVKSNEINHMKQEDNLTKLQPGTKVIEEKMRNLDVISPGKHNISTDDWEISTFLYKNFVENNSATLIPSVLKDVSFAYPRMIEKNEMIALIEYILNMLDSEGYIDADAKDRIVYEFANTFYYPGIYVSLNHLFELDKYIRRLPEEAFNIWCSFDLSKNVDIQHSWHLSTLVFKVDCKKCSMIYIEKTMFTVKEAIENLMKYCNRRKVHASSRCLLTDWSSHDYNWNRCQIVATTKEELLRFRYEIEKQKLLEQGYHVFNRNREVLISPEWSIIWKMAFTRAEYLCYYWWECKRPVLNKEIDEDEAGGYSYDNMQYQGDAYMQYQGDTYMQYQGHTYSQQHYYMDSYMEQDANYFYHHCYGSNQNQPVNHCLPTEKYNVNETNSCNNDQYAAANSYQNDKYDETNFSRNEHYDTTNSYRNNQYDTTNYSQNESNNTSNNSQNERYVTINSTQDEHYDTTNSYHNNQYDTTNSSQRERNETTNSTQDEQYDTTNSSQNERNDTTNSRQNEFNDTTNSSQNEHYDTINIRQNEVYDKTNSTQTERHDTTNSSQNKHNDTTNSSQNERNDTTNSRQNESNDTTNSRQNEFNDATNSSQNEHYDTINIRQNEVYDKTNSTQTERHDKTNSTQNERYDTTNSSQNETYDTTNPYQNDQNVASNSYQNERYDTANSYQNEHYDSTNYYQNEGYGTTYYYQNERSGSTNYYQNEHYDPNNFYQNEQYGATNPYQNERYGTRNAYQNEHYGASDSNQNVHYESNCDYQQRDYQYDDNHYNP